MAKRRVILNAAQVCEIKAQLAKGYTQVYIADVYEIQQSTVSDIKRGKRWRKVEC